MMNTLSYRSAFAAMRLIVVSLVLMACVAGLARAQTSLSLGGAGAPLAADEAFRLRAEARDDGSRVLTWEIEDGYYLYREHLAARTDTATALPLATEAGTIKDDPLFGPTEVYYGTAEAVLPPTDGPVEVTFQGCQEDGICYPPVTTTVSAAGVLGAPPASGEPEAATDPAANDQGASVDAKLTLADPEGGALDKLQARGGAPLVLGGFLVFGLLLAFTPCVFPMFPILAGLLAGQGTALTPRRGATLSLAYVLAMASAFAMLGVVAAWSGQNLQLVLQMPATVAVVAAIFVLLALSMFGLFELSLPASWTQRVSSLGGRRRGTIGGAAALGFTSALIVGPCVTAPLAGALLYIAQSGDVLLGAAALFAMGLGHGIPLLVVGIYGARILPRAGAWMDGAKRIFGFVFLGLAIWLLGRLIPGPATLALWAGLLVAAGAFLDPVDDASGSGAMRRARRAASALSTIAAVILALGAAAGGSDPLRPLTGLVASGAAETGAEPDFTQATSPEALSASLESSDGPALVYVTADWCVTCRAIERRVLPDPALHDALGSLTLIKADVSAFGPGSQAMLDELGAVGPPTMVFLDATRAEVAGTRIVGDTSAAEMIASAQAAIR